MVDYIALGAIVMFVTAIVTLGAPHITIPGSVILGSATLAVSPMIAQETAQLLIFVAVVAFLTAVITPSAPHITIPGSALLAPLGTLASVTTPRIAAYTGVTLVASVVLSAAITVTKNKCRPALAQAHLTDE